MIIPPKENGWSFDESNSWKLVHDGANIIFFEQIDKSISTQSILFIGTQEECEAEINRLGLSLASNDSLGEVQQEVIIIPSPEE
jgi:hypothetical protein